MKIIDKNITVDELKEMSKKMDHRLVKAVVDVEREVMAVDASMHADEEALLLDNDSQQEYLWGVNLYPEQYPDDWIEFDSIINIRPPENRTRGVSDVTVQEKIKKIVDKLVTNS